MPTKPVDQIFGAAQEKLDLARLGLQDLCGSDPSRRQPGLHNAVVFGRSVTFVLQNLRGIDADAFDEWYEPRRELMRRDPLLRWFNELRNDMLKAVSPPTTMSMHIRHLDSSQLQPLFDNPPPGARSFFIGDSVGGSGWEVERPDGETEKYYVQLPPEVEANITTALHLPEPPTEHLGRHLDDTSICYLVRLYVDYVEQLLRAANSDLSYLAVRGGS